MNSEIARLIESHIDSMTRTGNRQKRPNAWSLARDLYKRGLREMNVLTDKDYCILTPDIRVQIATLLYNQEKLDKVPRMSVVMGPPRNLNGNRICPSCNRDLATKNSVTRTYTSKNENPDSYCLGHYENDQFEADGKPSYPVVSHDLLDGSDTCTYCERVCG